MWPTKSGLSYCNLQERDAKLCRLYSQLSLARVQKDRTRCIEIDKQIKRCV